MAERFQRISRGGKAVDPELERIRAGMSVGRSSLPTPGEGEVLFAGGEEVRGEEGAPTVVSPVEAEVAQPEPIDPIEFFNRRSPMAREMQENPMTRRVQDAWWDKFARGFQQQKFGSLDDYVDYVTSIKGDAGEELSAEEILPFIQKQALEYMPQNVRAEYQAQQQGRMEDAQWTKQLQRLKDFNDDPDHKARGLVMGPDGKIKQVDPNKDFERKQKMFDGLNKRLEALEKMKPSLKDYVQGDVDAKSLKSAKSNKEYLRDLGAWETRINFVESRMQSVMGLAADEDKATGQGNPGASSSPKAMTATNPTTGEKIQSLDGGKTWQPMD